MCCCTSLHLVRDTFVGFFFYLLHLFFFFYFGGLIIASCIDLYVKRLKRVVVEKKFGGFMT